MISDHLTFPSSEDDKQTCLRSAKHHSYFDIQNGDYTKDHLNNNTLKDYFSLASFLCVTYELPFSYQLHKTFPSIRPL
jgi:hypothetical protein